MDVGGVVVVVAADVGSDGTPTWAHPLARRTAPRSVIAGRIRCLLADAAV
jgi:hypothetical protein